MSPAAEHIYTGIHLAAIGAFLAMVISPPWRSWFERHCLGTADARDLAHVRIVVCAVTLLYVLSEDIASCAALDPSWFRPPPYLIDLLGLERFRALITSPDQLRLLKLALVALLALGGAGVLTRITIPAATITYFVFAATLRSFGKYFHEGGLSMYALMALSLLPAGAAWSVDARWLRPLVRWPERRRSDTYHAWAVYACCAAIVIPYIQLGLSKLIHGGFYWFEGASMRNYMLTDNLNLTEWNIDLAVRFHGAPTFAFALAGLFALVCELSYPLVLFVPRLRRVLPWCIALVHLGVWLGQDALFLDAMLLPLVFFHPSQRRGPPR